MANDSHHEEVQQVSGTHTDANDLTHIKTELMSSLPENLHPNKRAIIGVILDGYVEEKIQDKGLDKTS